MQPQQSADAGPVASTGKRVRKHLTSAGWLTKEERDDWSRRTLVARLLSNATHRATADGYRVRGIRALDTIGPARAVAWVQLSYGSVVVAVNGMDDRSDFYATLLGARAGYDAERARLRALDM